MLLLIGRDVRAVMSVRDVFFGMGIITETVTPAGAAERISHRHSAVVAVGRELGIGAGELLCGIRSAGANIPTVAIRDDVLSAEASLFDAVFPGSLYCAGVVSVISDIAKRRGLRPPGEYNFDRITRHGVGVTVGEEPLSLTKSEVAILSVVMAFSPISVGVRDIATLAFRGGREPSESGVRTHISAINRQIFPHGYRIISDGDGYKIKILMGSSE